MQSHLQKLPPMAANLRRDDDDTTTRDDETTQAMQTQLQPPDPNYKREPFATHSGKITLTYFIILPLAAPKATHWSLHHTSCPPSAPANNERLALFQRPLSSSAVEQVLLSGVGHTKLGEMEGDGFLHWQSVHIPMAQGTAQLKFDVSSVVSRGKPPTKTTLRTLKGDINLFPQRPCDCFRQATQTPQLDFPCLAPV